ncbi:MAG: hypothetical protein L0228_07120 [Planctomycetes bacterium]|nr:hypothetical protein [Planctomycetota bacterium]
MKRLIYIASYVLVLLPARLADAHGTPISVGPAGGALTANGGLADDQGFAPQIFVEDDEDGDPFASLVLPNVGPVILWQIPGLNITGLEEQSSLSIEVLARPVKDASPPEDRILWYWNPLSELVEPAAADLHLLGTGMRYLTLSPDDSVAPPPFLLTNSMAGQQGFHNHGLLSYGLDNNPPPAHGAYGFFARLTSNQYSPSNPFLVAFNHGVNYEQMVVAALAINAAAVNSLPGDFNHDGVVDTADYVVWRKSMGSGPEYMIWSENFGRTMNGGRSISTANSPVPEPATIFMLTSAIIFRSIGRRRRVCAGNSHRVRAGLNTASAGR